MKKPTTDSTAFTSAAPTGAASSPLLHRSIESLLTLIRKDFSMDVVFISEFVGEQRIFRHVDQIDHPNPVVVGDMHKLQDSVCKRTLDGSLPSLSRDLSTEPGSDGLPPFAESIRAYMSVPVARGDGTVYGMLCCFSLKPSDTLCERDLRRLKVGARSIARLLAD